MVRVSASVGGFASAVIEGMAGLPDMVKPAVKAKRVRARAVGKVRYKGRFAFGGEEGGGAVVVVVVVEDWGFGGEAGGDCVSIEPSYSLI